MATIGTIYNPRLDNYGKVHCEVDAKIGDGVGAESMRVPYVASRGDVAATGNQVWTRLCEGDFEVEDGFEVNFNYADLIPD